MDIHHIILSLPEPFIYTILPASKLWLCTRKLNIYSMMKWISRGKIPRSNFPQIFCTIPPCDSGLLNPRHGFILTYHPAKEYFICCSFLQICEQLKNKIGLWTKCTLSYCDHEQLKWLKKEKYTFMYTKKYIKGM